MEYQQYLNMKKCVAPADISLALEQEGNNTPASAALNIGILQKIPLTCEELKA